MLRSTAREGTMHKAAVTAFHLRARAQWADGRAMEPKVGTRSAGGGGPIGRRWQEPARALARHAAPAAERRHGLSSVLFLFFLEESPNVW